MKNYKKYGIRMCTIRHCVIVWVLMEIPEKMLTEFIILKRGLLKRNVYMKDGRQAVLSTFSVPSIEGQGS